MIVIATFTAIDRGVSQCVASILSATRVVETVVGIQYGQECRGDYLGKMKHSLFPRR